MTPWPVLDKVFVVSNCRAARYCELLETVYAGEDLALPQLKPSRRHVSSITPAPMSKSDGRLLEGDFTPPKTAHVAFDTNGLSDGTTVPISQ